MLRHRLALAPVLSCVLLGGCWPPDDTGAKAPTTTPADATAPAAPVSTPTPGHATGRIVGPGGGPFAFPGAKVSVRVNGVTGLGETVSLRPAVDAQGAFDLELPHGNFSASATTDCMWKGKNYPITLHPVQDNSVDRPSAPGFVQDFEWRLHGLRAGAIADEGNHTRWYGSTLSVTFQSYRKDLGKGVNLPPVGTKAVFTVTPTGPLIDGTAGKTLTFERPYDERTSMNNFLCDIPVGTYRVTAVEISPGGRSTPLLLQETYSAPFAASIEVTLDPAYLTLGFTRDPD